MNRGLGWRSWGLVVGAVSVAGGSLAGTGPATAGPGTGPPSLQAVPSAHGAPPRVPPTPPDDPLYPRQWNLPAIGIPEAWSAADGSGAVVAVIDTGVAYEDVERFRRAPDLAGTAFVPGWDFVDDDDRPDDEAVPGLPTHGTHIAGTIAGTTGNGLGTASVAPAASIMPVRVLNPDRSGTGSAIASGLRFAADHGANVANLSIGGRNGTPELADAVAYAASKGVLVIASSGDEGNPSLLFPAAYTEVVAVGAVRTDLTRPAYSSYGPELDLVAPGGDRSADQNGDGVDDGIVQQTVFGQQDSFCFCSTEGTSSAAAHVSGVAALVWSALAAEGGAPDPAAVRDALLSTARDLGPPGRDDEFGSGLVQAAAAVAAARSSRQATPTEGAAPPPAAGTGTHSSSDQAPAVPASSGEEAPGETGTAPSQTGPERPPEREAGPKGPPERKVHRAQGRRLREKSAPDAAGRRGHRLGDGGRVRPRRAAHCDDPVRDAAAALAASAGRAARAGGSPGLNHRPGIRPIRAK